MDATWHARPHGPTRVLACHGCDMYIYYIYLYIGYSTYKHSIEELANGYNPVYLTYPTLPLDFFSVGLILLFQVMRIVGFNRVDDRASMRWTRGPPDL